jgi:hypothetical protein
LIWLNAQQFQDSKGKSNFPFDQELFELAKAHGIRKRQLQPAGQFLVCTYLHYGQAQSHFIPICLILRCLTHIFQVET